MLAINNTKKNELRKFALTEKNLGPKVYAPTLNKRQKNFLKAVRTILHNKMDIAHFLVHNQPPSIFVNYKIRPDKIEAFKKAIKLPKGVKLMPVTNIEGKKPEYMITLNAYKVSGLVNGMRGDLSTYIDRGDGKPAYLFLDLFADHWSLDPVNLVTKPCKFTYTSEKNDNKQLDINIKTKGNHSFRFSFKGDPLKLKTEGKADRAWLGANDYCYYAENMVADRVFMDGQAFNSPLKKIPVSKVNVEYNLPYKEFIEQKPHEITTLSQPSRFIIIPWANLTGKETFN
jgi:hypothetical protein